MSNIYESQLAELYKNAKENFFVEYIYTLVRVAGYGEGKDSLLLLQSRFDTVQRKNSSVEYFNVLREAILNEEIYILLANLSNCSLGKRYNSYPFMHLYKDDEYGVKRPSPIEYINELINIFSNEKYKKLIRSIKNVFNANILSYLQSEFSIKRSDSFSKNNKNLFEFIRTLINMYFDERLKFKDSPKLYKCLPYYEVLELLIDDSLGLIGFRVYFSNGNSAFFTRTRENTACLNLVPSDGVAFQVGNIEQPKKEFRIGNKRLYEIGLPGRYNNLGEWKPIIYPDAKAIDEEAAAVSSDERVQGIFFYMVCTGHRGIEFVVRTTLELPLEFMNFGKDFHLYKCQSKENDRKSNDLTHIYDGHMSLETGSIEEIETGLRRIGYIMNIIGFTYGVPIDWRIKYRRLEYYEPIVKPSVDDLKVLNNVLNNVPSDGNDADIMNSGLDWYVRGRTSKNIFIRFLSYYIAIESVSLAISSDKGNFGITLKHETKSERKKRKIEGIQQLHDKMYSANPIEFVNQAYSNYVVSIKNDTRQVVESVFGPKSEYLSSLFDKKPSLCSIRGKIAHGSMAMWEKDNEILVREHLKEMQDISWEFLMRIILKLKPSESLPDWYETHSIDIQTIDPRSTLWCSDENIFPHGVDWSIRPEWVD